MSYENRKRMYEQIKNDPIRLKASGLDKEFGTAPQIQTPKVEPEPKKKRR